MSLPGKVHPGFSARYIEAAVENNTPSDLAQATDVYFLRTLQIMQALEYDPWIVAQVFVRHVPESGTGRVDGVQEVLAVLSSTRFFERGGKVWAVPVGSEYRSCDTLLVIHGYAQDLVILETIYLGLLSHRMTEANMGPFLLDERGIVQRFEAIKSAMKVSPFGVRPIMYFGARHYAWWFDSKITQLAYEAGVRDVATPGGAYANVSEGPKGTIPHFLVLIMAYRHGMERATEEATVAFDKIIDRRVSRMTLPDTRNCEITDTIASARKLDGRLFAVRLDTSGAALAQGAARDYQHAKTLPWFTDTNRELWLPDENHPRHAWFYGNGVTVTGAMGIRHGLDKAGFGDIKIALTSGFSDPRRTLAYAEAEVEWDVKLFDVIGLGEVQRAYFATMDIVAVGDAPDAPLSVIHKVHREPRPNPRLIPAMGEIPADQDAYYFLQS